MLEPKPLPKLIEDRYGDRGGWKGLIAIYTGKLRYEDKMIEVKNQYRVSIATAQDWYGKWRRLHAEGRKMGL